MQIIKKRIKNQFILLIFFAFICNLNAQLPKKSLSIGTGLLGGNGKIMTKKRSGILQLSNQLVTTTSVYQVPIHGAIMLQISPRFGIGLEAATVAVKQNIVREVNNILTFDGKCYNIAGRVNYYFAQKPTFQAYIGAGLGISKTAGKAISQLNSGQIINLDDYSDDYLYTDLVVGGRYFFTKNVGIYSELGFIRISGQGTFTTQLGGVVGF